MSPPIRRSTVTALALTASLALTAPTAWAGDSRARGHWESREVAASLLSRAWSWLTGLWDADSTLPPPDPGSGGDHRCSIDPNGVGCPAPAPANPGPTP